MTDYKKGEKQRSKRLQSEIEYMDKSVIYAANRLTALKGELERAQWLLEAVNSYTPIADQSQSQERLDFIKKEYMKRYSAAEQKARKEWEEMTSFLATERSILARLKKL